MNEQLCSKLQGIIKLKKKRLDTKLYYLHNSANMNMRKLDELVNIFKALSDKSRLRIANILIKAGCELCVCEIADSLIESQYNISRHLKELKNAGLISERRDGRWINYQITDTNEPFQGLLIKTLSFLRDDLFIDDEKRLKVRLSMRRDGICVVGLKSVLTGKGFNKGGRFKNVQKAK